MRRFAGTVMMALMVPFLSAGCFRSTTKVEPPPIVHAPPSDRTETPVPPVTERDGTASPAVPGAAQGTETAVVPPEGAPAQEIDRTPSTEVEGVPVPEAGGRPSAAEGSIGAPEQKIEQELPALPENAPFFVREHEVLVYRVEFLGLTMGYARFRFRGIVRTGGRLAYHLTVRAWTSDLLSVFYPMNDTIDYYLDVNTLAPIRQDFTNSRSEDDIAYYDQKTGEIVYRYKKNGKIRKKVETVPGVYDPVSAVYYFRTQSLLGEEPALPMYVGRKLLEVSVKPVGDQTIRTDRGKVDTVMIEPVIRRNGKQEHKGNIRVWMTRDARHVPVRLYAKFKKVRTWTLVGVLVPQEGGG